MGGEVSAKPALGACANHLRCAADRGYPAGVPRVLMGADLEASDFILSQPNLTSAPCLRHPSGRVRFGTGVSRCNPRFAAQAQAPVMAGEAPTVRTAP